MLIHAVVACGKVRYRRRGDDEMNDDLLRDVIPDQPTPGENSPACLVVCSIVAVLVIVAVVLLWLAVTQYRGGLIP